VREALKRAYCQACEIELQAFKPGNVSVYSEGHDMTVGDFRMSLDVSSEPITDPAYSVGEKIFFAVRETRNAVGCNTNLGIILLSAPLIHAAQVRQEGQTLRQALTNVLKNTTVEDADWVFQAISLASPGGLGDSDQADVNEKPSITLLEAMKIAQNKDRIAYQFTSDYKDIFEFTILLYNSILAKFGNFNWAALAVYAEMLARYPDSHIERKFGPKYSGWVSAKMQEVQQALVNTDEPESLLPLLSEVDQAFKDKGINPGTTADITVATVLVFFLEQLVNR
jgi:triphosphoribosyl-dephospho-CoA synthase